MTRRCLLSSGVGGGRHVPDARARPGRSDGLREDIEGERFCRQRGLLAGGVLSTTASVIFGSRRVRYLRRDLAALRELRSKLEPDGDRVLA
jgi:hypothetical protein